MSCSQHYIHSKPVTPVQGCHFFLLGVQLSGVFATVSAELKSILRSFHNVAVH